MLDCICGMGGQAQRHLHASATATPSNTPGALCRGFPDCPATRSSLLAGWDGSVAGPRSSTAMQLDYCAGLTARRATGAGALGMGGGGRRSVETPYHCELREPRPSPELSRRDAGRTAAADWPAPATSLRTSPARPSPQFCVTTASPSHTSPRATARLACDTPCRRRLFGSWEHLADCRYFFFFSFFSSFLFLSSSLEHLALDVTGQVPTWDNMAVSGQVRVHSP
jgi:hypothetical protein